MYGQNQIKPQQSLSELSAKLQGAACIGGTGMTFSQSPESAVSETQCELNRLHNTLGHYRNLQEEIIGRLRPVSISQPQTAECGTGCQGPGSETGCQGPGSEIAQQIASARYQIESLTESLRETIDRLCI